MDIREMESCRRLIEDIDRFSGSASGKLCGELDPLRLSAGKLRWGLSKTDIGKSHIVQCRDLSRDRRHILKEL